MKKVLLIVCCFFPFISFGDNDKKETVQVSKKDFKECVDIYKKIDVAYKPTTVQITKYLTNTNFFDKYGKDKKDPIKINKSDIDNILKGLQIVLTQSKTDSAFKRQKVKGKVIILKERVNETGKIDSLKSKISDTKIFIPATSGSVLSDKQIEAKFDSLNDVIENLKNDNNDLNKEIEDLKKDGKSSWGILNIFLAILSIIGFGAFAREHFRVLPNTIKEKDKMLETFSNSQRENFNMKEEEWKAEKKSLNYTITALNEEVKSKGNIGSGGMGNGQKQDEKPQTEGKAAEPAKTPENPRQFYLSTPAVSSDGKGVFDGSEVYNATSISSLYHFVLINDKAADFTFLNTPNTVKDALTLPERYLQPACEYTGLNSKATKIITGKAGRAVKEGNNWKVQTKAEIRFE